MALFSAWVGVLVRAVKNEGRVFSGRRPYKGGGSRLYGTGFGVGFMTCRMLGCGGGIDYCDYCKLL